MNNKEIDIYGKYFNISNNLGRENETLIKSIEYGGIIKDKSFWKC